MTELTIVAHETGTLPNAGFDMLAPLSDGGPPSSPGTSQDVLLEQELQEIQASVVAPDQKEEPPWEQTTPLPSPPTSKPSTSTVTTKQPQKTALSEAPVLQYV